MRREWIEIQRTLYHTATVWSPSMRREWIEIADFAKDAFENMVSLHAEGVDLNITVTIIHYILIASPSMRREWIEITGHDA